MGGLFSSQPVTPLVAPAPPPPPTRSDADVQAAALRVRQQRASAQGRASTILTGSQGVTDEIESTPKKLLGAA